MNISREEVFLIIDEMISDLSDNKNQSNLDFLNKFKDKMNRFNPPLLDKVLKYLKLNGWKIIDYYNGKKLTHPKLDSRFFYHLYEYSNLESKFIPRIYEQLLEYISFVLKKDIPIIRKEIWEISLEENKNEM